MYNVSCTALLISLFKLFYVINHNLLMLFSPSILVPCLQHQRQTLEISRRLKPLRKPIARGTGCRERFSFKNTDPRNCTDTWITCKSRALEHVALPVACRANAAVYMRQATISATDTRHAAVRLAARHQRLHGRQLHPRISGLRLELVFFKKTARDSPCRVAIWFQN